MAKARNLRRHGNRWEAYLRVNGKQQQATFRSKGEAEVWLANQRLEKRKDERPAEAVSFAEAADEWVRWVQERADRPVKPSTLDDYKHSVADLKEAFGDRLLTNVTDADIEDWQSKLIRDGLSRRTVNKKLTAMNGIYRRARKRYGVRTNPVADVERLRERYDASSYDFYSPDEVQALVRAADSDQDRAFFLTAAFAGLRRGECIGLRWRDIDFEGDAIRVERNVYRGVSGSTKGGLARVVPMVPEVAQALARLSQRPNRTASDDPVFAGARGGFVAGRALSRRFEKALGRAGLRRIRFHDLRHTFGSLGVNQAESVVELQAWMGHSDQRTTARYLHHKQQRDGAKRLARAFAVEEAEDLSPASGLPADAPHRAPQRSTP
jgi:integrase